MIIKMKVKDFDFNKTFNSGLFYFFYEERPIRRIYFDNNFLDLEFKQEDKNFLLIKVEGVLRKKQELIRRLRYCLGLYEDMTPFYKLCKKDRVMKNYLNKIRGTRVISAFSDFEALVGAIISQNNSYKIYRKKMRDVYMNLNFIPQKFNEKNLNRMRLGYKIPYLIGLAKNQNRELDEIKGIGQYSKNLFEIFQKRNYNAFYIDCLTEKILREKYGINKNLEEETKRLWGNYRGLVEAYLQRFFEKKIEFITKKITNRFPKTDKTTQ